MKKRIAALFGLGMVLASAAPAFALPNAFRDGQNNIYVLEQSPQSRVSLTYQGMMRSRDYQANSCGWITLRNSSTSPISGTISVAGTSVNTATLPTQLLPSCTNGVAQEARNANFKTNTGDVIIVGRTPSSYVTIGVPQDRIRNATANACGIARFTNSTSYQHSPTTAIQSIAFSEGSIQDLPAMDAVLCSRGTLYVPASWLGGS